MSLIDLPSTEPMAFKPKKGSFRKHPNMWWEKYDHPLNDADFVEAFCDHVFRTTSDTSIVGVRNRVHRFIRVQMRKDMENQLNKYREDYP